MPEANVLYGVTAVVVVGLVAWVAFVLKTAREPWARAELAASPPAPPASAEASAESAAREAKTEDGEAGATAGAAADEET